MYIYIYIYICMYIYIYIHVYTCIAWLYLLLLLSIIIMSSGPRVLGGQLRPELLGELQRVCVQVALQLQALQHTVNTHTAYIIVRTWPSLYAALQYTT